VRMNGMRAFLANGVICSHEWLPRYLILFDWKAIVFQRYCEK
jgi:hypothetical protein